MSEVEHPLDWLPELALGVLADDEAASVRAHLQTCATCRAEFETMHTAARLLPFAVQEVEPPPGTRAGLMQRIAAEPRELRQRNVIRPVWQRFAAIAAAAAVFIAVGGVAGALMFGGSDSALKEESKNQRTLVQAVAQGTASRETAEQGGTRATLVFAPGTDAAFAWLEGMPALPEGKEYQGWFIGTGAPLPANVFADSSAGVWFDAPEAVDKFAAFALTIEDDGGAAQPTTEPFVVVSLQSAARTPFTWQDWIALTMRD